MPGRSRTETGFRLITTVTTVVAGILANAGMERPVVANALKAKSSRSGEVCSVFPPGYNSCGGPGKYGFGLDYRVYNEPGGTNLNCDSDPLGRIHQVRSRVVKDVKGCCLSGASDKRGNCLPPG
jgi:hypothetical protein